MIMKNRLKILMAERGINSVSELHRMIQEQGHTMSRRTLDKFARNENNQVHYDTLITLCQVLNCQIHELLIIQEESND
ncbi:helix-turn-helix domain-containing protein [Halalkalibacter krulwichiae]|uniref:HTH cro/C1-type domain-containing protein n=2 Tax=Halalkalibacter krulwichiae TaxID=199441 RepID=A0A1X9M5M5_9BACI|nr:helix-turn-helix transcriptional regulator [Halalkalibacter krulwichiae]ARK28756.1 hypothetical protein BkAM31D_02215 [Halalkalibacter krulwichiae]